MASKLFYRAISSFVLCFLMAAHSCGKNQSNLAEISAKQEVSRESCQKNDDCTVAKANCCGCKEGGKQRPILKSLKKSFNVRLRDKCSDTVCPQVISKDPSCKSKAVCKDKECVLESN